MKSGSTQSDASDFNSLEWNRVSVSNQTKDFAWKSVMDAFHLDKNVPAYAKSLMELLVAERRHLLSSQLELFRKMDAVEDKVTKILDSSTQCVSFIDNPLQSPPVAMRNQRAFVPAEHSLSPTPGSNQDILVSLLNNATNGTSSTPGVMNLGDVDESGEEEENEDIKPEISYMADRQETTSRKRKEPIGEAERPSSSETAETAPKRSASTRRSRRKKRDPLKRDLCPCKYFDCGESFETQGELQLHVRSHMNNSGKPQCPMCGLVCHSLIRFRDHINQHTGERPYECSKCGKGFSRKDGMLSHSRKCLLEDLGRLGNEGEDSSPGASHQGHQSYFDSGDGENEASFAFYDQ